MFLHLQIQEFLIIIHCQKKSHEKHIMSEIHQSQAITNNFNLCIQLLSVFRVRRIGVKEFLVNVVIERFWAPHNTIKYN